MASCLGQLCMTTDIYSSRTCNVQDPTALLNYFKPKKIARPTTRIYTNWPPCHFDVLIKVYYNLFIEIDAGYRQTEKKFLRNAFCCLDSNKVIRKKCIIHERSIILVY